MPDLGGKTKDLCSSEGNLSSTRRERCGDQEDCGEPELGEDEELYDYFFWEAQPGEEEAESDNRERHTIVLEGNEKTAVGTTKEAILLKWHRLLGHINPFFLLRIAPNVKGMEEVSRLPAKTKMPQCDACEQAKSKRKPRQKSTFKRYPEVMYMLHSDLSGRLRVPSLQGARYFVVFLDDASNYKFVFLLKTKDKWLEALKRITVMTGRTPKVVQTDNAGEMTSGECIAYYSEQKIFHKACAPDEHEQNPRAESAIGSLSMRCRVMLFASGLPKFYWGFCIIYCAEIENRTLPFKANSTHTCYQAFHGQHRTTPSSSPSDAQPTCTSARPRGKIKSSTPRQSSAYSSGSVFIWATRPMSSAR